MATEPWWQRLRRDREARGLSRVDAVRHLIAYADHYVPSDAESVLKTWERWESGNLKGLPTVEDQRAIANLFGTVRDAYFGPPGPVAAPIPLADGDTLELIQRLRALNIDNADLDMARVMTDRLCSNYSAHPDAAVLQQAEGLLSQIAALKERNLPFRQLRGIYEIAGWLSLLVACLHYDQGNERAAQSARAGAIALGEEIGHGEILAWTAEIKAWIALTHGDYYAVLAAAKQGLKASPRHSAAVQLHGQSAKAWARLGDRRQVELALERARELLNALPYPLNPRNHFQIDPAKFDFYAMDCYRALGEDALAMSMAQAVKANSLNPGGEVIAPMRLAEAELTQATVFARAGEVDLAAQAAESGLGRDRRSLPSLLMVGNEVSAVMRRLHPHNETTNEFDHRLHHLDHPRPNTDDAE